MPIQLDKILGDIAEEKVLHPFHPSATKKETEEAWSRVGKKSKLSVHEARSIFKVLQKKYEQEKIKDTSSWKLFSMMESIHKKVEEKESDRSGLAEDEEEFVEMLEVHEEEEGESEKSPIRKNNITHSPEKEQKSDNTGIKIINNQKQQIAIPKSSTNDFANTMLHKKGIVMKKAQTSSTPTSTPKTISQSLQNALTAAAKSNTAITQVKTINTLNSIELTNNTKSTYLNDNKRKLSADAPTHSLIVKKQILSSSSPSTVSSISTFPIVEVKQEPDDIKPELIHPKINVITIPGNPTSADLANGITATSSTNGYSCIEDIDFRNDIIFDSGSSVTAATVNQTLKGTLPSDIINIGNFENHLPPSFFKNLCNSNRHEALGLYVANVMNRVTPRVADKLELKILRAIIDAKSEGVET